MLQLLNNKSKEEQLIRALRTVRVAFVNCIYITFAFKNITVLETDKRNIL